MAESCYYCYRDFEEIDAGAAKKHLRPVALEPLKAARDRFAALEDWQAGPIHDCIEAVAEEQGINLGKLGQPLRVAVTGDSVSPPIDVTLYLVGKERSLARIDHAIELVEKRAAAG